MTQAETNFSNAGITDTGAEGTEDQGQSIVDSTSSRADRGVPPRQLPEPPLVLPSQLRSGATNPQRYPGESPTRRKTPALATRARGSLKNVSFGSYQGALFDNAESSSRGKTQSKSKRGVKKHGRDAAELTSGAVDRTTAEMQLTPTIGESEVSSPSGLSPGGRVTADSRLREIRHSSHIMPEIFRAIPGLPPIPLMDGPADDTSTRLEDVELSAFAQLPNRSSMDSTLVENRAINHSSQNRMPNIQEPTAADLTSRSQRRRVIALMILAAIVIASTVGTVLSRSPKPLPRMYRNITMEEFRDFLLPAISLQEATRDPLSPQGRALRWLEYDTAGRQTLGRQMLQRFTLAAIFFSFGGERWFNQSGWLSSLGECSWFCASLETEPCDSSGNIVFLGLWANNLTGPIPYELSLLARLEVINLSENGIFGAIPNDIKSLSQARSVDLSKNQINGTIPTELGNVPKLGVLSLHENSLSGALPTEIGMLSELKQLSIFDNFLSGSVPSEIGLLKNLEGFAADNNRLEGSIPSEMGRLSGLKILSLLNNSLSGTVPPQVR
jgi:hypothetical protein